MKRFFIVMIVLLLGLALVSCTTLQGSSASDGLDKTQPIDDPNKEPDDNENPVEIPIKPSKLSMPNGLTVEDNCLNWNPVSHISGYQIRIAGLDWVKRSVVDNKYEIKPDTTCFVIPELNEGEYFLLVMAKSDSEEYLNSDCAVFEYRIGVEAGDENFENCHNNWSGWYTIFESTEETEGLFARYCFTCLKSHIGYTSALPTDGEWMFFTPINGRTEYLVYGHSPYSEKPYTEVIIPEFNKGKPVTQIKDYAFNRMLNLKSVFIPKSIAKIGEAAFSNCPLDTITVDPDNPYFKMDEGCLIDIKSNSIIAATSSSIIPSYITKIGRGAFAHPGITSVTIPASVKEVGVSAFNDCFSLESVFFEEGSQLTRISIGMFSGCTNLKNIVLPQSITSIGEDAFSLCESLVSLVIPKNCIKIELLAFAFWTPLQTVYITAFASKEEADQAYDYAWDGFDISDTEPRAIFLFVK